MSRVVLANSPKMQSVVFRRLALVITFSSLLLTRPLSESKASLAKPNCRETCGNVTIPYPFGMGESRCFLNSYYEITCNNNGTVPRPFLSKYNLEVLKIDNYYMVVNNPVYSTCRDESSWNSTDFSGSVFSFSTSRNKLYGVGCQNTRIKDRDGRVMAGCTSSCGRLDSYTVGCYGIHCCQTQITKSSNFDFYTHTSFVNTSACTYGFLTNEDWLPTDFASNASVIEDMNHIPVYLNWGIERSEYEKLYARSDADALYYCGKIYYNNNKNNIFGCQCHSSLGGNPYIANGCVVGEECNNCKGTCRYNLLRGSFECTPSKTKKIIVQAMGGGALMIILFISCIGLFKIIKKRRITRRKQRFYKRNGGLLLQQKLSTNNDSLEIVKIFGENELEKATDNFNIDRVLGEGGQGTVYKGMLADGTMVAVKKSRLVDEGQVEHFINELVILSKVNHMNIVQLLGFCLETEVPLLVYEYISNGTLSHLIRNQEEFPLSWEMRLRIAAEVSGALAYLHSATSVPIYHRDIKSCNILLDDKYRAKVADFGISRSVAIDQTHLTTVVQGTFGYLDPEFFRSSQFTDKSDVYSYGVVLAELLTGERPILLQEEVEERSLAAIFVSSLEKDKDSLFDIIDERVAREGNKAEITTLAILANKCLNMNGKRRPAMKQVMCEIEKIRGVRLPSTVREDIFQEKSISMSNKDNKGKLGSPSFSSYTDRHSA